MNQSQGTTASVWNLPNILTMLRIAIVPFFVWFLVLDAQVSQAQGNGFTAHNGMWRWLAALAFALAIYTDKLDGDIARARELVTNFGKIADPIADKFLIGSALVMLSILTQLPWWITIVILLREWGITLIRFVVIRYGVIPAGNGGKLKTVLQSLGIFMFLLPYSGMWEWLAVSALIVMILATIVTLWTGGGYILQAMRIRSKALAQEPGNSGNHE